MIFIINCQTRAKLYTQSTIHNNCITHPSFLSWTTHPVSEGIKFQSIDNIQNEAIPLHRFALLLVIYGHTRWSQYRRYMDNTMRYQNRVLS